MPQNGPKSSRRCDLTNWWVVPMALILPALILPRAAQAAGDPALAKDVLVRSIAFRTVEGQGQVPRLAAYYASVLRQAGFAAAEVEIMPMRSEEHTSELQSLMRISYAVFC